MRWAPLALALTLLAAVEARADMADAWAAFDAGEYGAALAEFRRLAEAGDPRAQLNVGLFYFDGYGVARDHAEAALWFEKAAEQGVVPAQYNLGLIYAEGMGVGRDDVRAYMWFELAVRHGFAAAREVRDRVAGRMSAEEVARAEALVEAWLAERGRE